MSHETTKKQEIPHYEFKPEGYASTSDAEFLDELLKMLKASGFDPGELVFSGFEGKPVTEGKLIPRLEGVFVMNEAAWRKAIKLKETNPAEYAEDWDVPCIGLYDRRQLVRVYSHQAPEHPMNLEESGETTPVKIGDNTFYTPERQFVDERVEPTNIELGDALANLSPEVPVEEAIAHKDHPNASPTDALVGLVFLDQ